MTGSSSANPTAGGSGTRSLQSTPIGWTRFSATQLAATPAPDLDRIARDLAVRFRGVFSPETVQANVEESYELLARGSQSPLLASRTATFAATRLDALGRARRSPPTGSRLSCSSACRTPAGRSLPRGSSGSSPETAWSVRTAGSEPAGDVRHTVVAALDEIGVAARRGVPEAPHRRRRSRRRRRRHHGLRRRLSGLSRAAGISTGISKTRWASPSSACVRFATTSNAGCASCWPNSSPRVQIRFPERIDDGLCFL